MKKILLAVLAMFTLAIPAISEAAPDRPGPYISGFLGVTVPSDADTTGFFNDTIRYDPGINVGGTMGMDFGVVRVEGEISYKEGNIDSVTDNDTGQRFTGIDGGVDATAFMGNFFVDLHGPGPITPYFGGGVGFAALNLNDTFDQTGLLLYAEDDEVVFAYQAGAGLEIALNRQMSLDLAYRYFRTSEASFADIDLEFESHNATAGFRFKF